MARVYRPPSEPLTSDEAWAVLEPYWIEIVAEFKAKSLLAPTKISRVEVDPAWHDTCRHFAGATTDASVVIFAPELADMPVPTIRAIMAHEAGHLSDFAAPGIHWYRPMTALPLREGLGATVFADGSPKSTDPVLMIVDKLPGKNIRKHMEQWRSRSTDEVEMVADQIAEMVMGQKIGYVGPSGCIVQTLGRGKTRPKGLR